MQSALAHPDPAAALAVPPGIVARLLGTVLGDAPTLDSTTSRAPGTTWQEAVEGACRGRGLRVRPALLSARDAVGIASARTPLVTRVATQATAGAPLWLLLLERSNSRVRVASPEGPDRWLRPAELADLVGRPDAETALPWMVGEPELPSGPAASAMTGMPPLQRLMGLLEPERADLWTIVLYAVLIGALTLATPIAVQQLVNSVAFGGLVQPVVVLALLLFGGLAFSGLLTAIQAVVAESIQRRVFVRVVIDLAARLPRVRARAFDASHGPELVNRIFDVVTIQKVGALLLLDGTSVVLQTVVGLLVLSFYHPWMLAFSVLLVGSASVVIFVFGRGAISTAIGESNAKYAIAGWMEELARHRAAFRSAEARDYALARADALAAAYVGARRRHFRIVLRQLSSALGLQVLAGSALLALGGGLVVAGQLTLGQLVASELILTAIVAAVAKLAKQLESYYDLLAAVDKLGVLFDLPLEREDGRVADAVEGPARLELRNVFYGYSAGGPSAIRDLSFSVEAGEHTAVVGPAGSGKSTLLDLLAGLRAPSEGYVAIDGHDLRELRLDALREQVVYVRDTEVFSGSVLDNVRVSTTGPTVDEVVAALDAVGLLEEIRALPAGLQTQLATDGAPLSRGQAARLMLARAIAARPRLLLLDEAFVEISEGHRKRALDALFDAAVPWTVITVSERADVIERCSCIVELRSARESLDFAAEEERP